MNHVVFGFDLNVLGFGKSKLIIFQTFAYTERITEKEKDIYCIIINGVILYYQFVYLLKCHCKANLDTTLDSALFSDNSFLFSVFSFGDSFKIKCSV